MKKPTPKRRLRGFSIHRERGATHPAVADADQPGRSWLNESALKLFGTAVAGLGTISLLGYFLYIRYFPPFDTAAVASLLLSLSFVVLPLCALMSAVLLSPYFVIGMSVRARPGKRDDINFNTELVVWVVTAAACFFTFGLLLLIYAYLECPMDWVWLLYISIVLLLFCLYVLAVRARHRNRYRKIYTVANAGRYRRLCAWRRVRDIWISRFFATMLVGALTASPLSLVFLVLGKASEIRDDDLWAAGQAIVWTGIVAATVGYFAIHMLYSPKWRASWRLLVVMVLALPPVASFLAQAPGVLPMSIAHITKLGNFRAERMTLSAKACPILASYLDLDCQGGMAFQVCNLHVMSRVGSETYLRIAANEMDNAQGHVVKAVFIPTETIEGLEADFTLRPMRLAVVNEVLKKQSSSCPTNAATLLADSAFGFDGFTLNAEGRTSLARLLASVRASTAQIERIEVTGHADLLGTPEHNDWLAMRRAREVELYLAGELRNVPKPPPIVVGSMGSKAPLITSCKDNKQRVACEAPNRRVDIKVVEKPRPKQDKGAAREPR